jgi:hypothetical protein
MPNIKKTRIIIDTILNTLGMALIKAYRPTLRPSFLEISLSALMILNILKICRFSLAGTRETKEKIIIKKSRMFHVVLM